MPTTTVEQGFTVLAVAVDMGGGSLVIFFSLSLVFHISFLSPLDID